MSSVKTVSNLSEFMSEPLAHQLMAVLSQELACLQQMQGQLLAKTQVLVSGNLDAIAAVDAQLLHLSKQAETLALQRQEMLAMSHLPPNISLKVLIPLLPQSCQVDGMALRNVLLSTAQDVARMNQEHRSLVALSLQWAQDTVEVIINALQPEAASYDAQGSSKRGVKRHASVPSQAHSTITHSV